MNIMKEIAIKRLSAQKDENKNRCLLEQPTFMFQWFQNVFRVLDNVFLLLCIPGLDEEEVNGRRENLIVLEKMWFQLYINIKPKAHVLFDNTLQQVIEFGGIANKAEDYVEKAHQINKKLDHFTSHLK